MMAERALKFASIWLLNPVVATISTRGSSEGLLGVMVVGLLWAVLSQRILLAGMLLGLAVHFKIYPFIYGLSIIWFLESSPDQAPEEGISLPAKCSKQPSKLQRAKAFITPDRITLLLSSLATFTSLNILMYFIYSTPFLKHTFLHHLTRIDHRHNFSPYNTLLHLSSANSRATGLRFESLAFLPQLILSAVLIPLVLAKKDLAGTMLAQTFAFVAFNKVCTSQVRNGLILNTSNIPVRNLCLSKGHVSRGLLLRESHNISPNKPSLSTYGHRLKNNRHPVRSAKDKLQIGQLVVGSVTTSEYWLLYVFCNIFPAGGGRGVPRSQLCSCPLQGLPILVEISHCWETANRKKL